MAVDYRISSNGKQHDQVSEDCIICCEKVTDRAFVNNCLHYFCYACIKQWIKVRAVCPLCVQPIDSIISNVRSADDYDLQTVEPPETDILSNYWDTDAELWPAIYDDDDMLDLTQFSSDDSAPEYLSTESESSPSHDFHDTMDEDYEDEELISDCDIDVNSNSDDDIKSHFSSDSEMGEENWQDVAWLENNTETNELEEHSEYDSEEETEEPFDFTYENLDNLYDSDDNSPADLDLSIYNESAESEYEYHTDEEDYDPDFSSHDLFDDF